MLRSRRMRCPRISDIWHKRAVTHRPDIRPFGDLQELVHAHSASFLCARERKDKRAGNSSGSPYQSAAWNWDSIGQKDLILCHALNPGVKPDFDAASRKYLLRVSSQAFTKFWQDHRAGMNEHNLQHIVTQIRVERQRFSHKVV